MGTTLNVKTEVLQYYIDKSQIPVDFLQEKVKYFEQMVNGEKQPTFNQLSSLAKVLNVPTGLLALNEIIDVSQDRLAFRTLNSKNLEGMSDELKDTITEMEEKQAFLKGELSEELSFIGKYSIVDSPLELANEIRQVLGIPVDYYNYTRKDAVKYLRERINRIGVFVFFNGKIKDNTHRPLELKEFRGFALSDKQAPIIFINQKDSKNGQLFTLVHELVHLFLDSDDIFNLIETREYQFDPTEAFVNKVTAEILVPESELLKRQHEDYQKLAGYFQVSEFVIIRRFLDMKLITKSKYNRLLQELEEKMEQIIRLNENKSSGNYRNNIKFRLDNTFFNYVDNALKQNRITYTEAFGILGVGYKGYKILEERRNT